MQGNYNPYQVGFNQQPVLPFTQPQPQYASYGQIPNLQIQERFQHVPPQQSYNPYQVTTTFAQQTFNYNPTPWNTANEARRNGAWLSHFEPKKPPTEDEKLEKKYGHGYKLLSKMGYRADQKKGLGKSRQGRENPVEVKMRASNEGLGHEKSNELKEGWTKCEVCNVIIPPKKVEQHEEGRRHRENLLKYAGNTISCNRIEDEEICNLGEAVRKRNKVKFRRAARLEDTADGLKQIKDGVSFMQELGAKVPEHTAKIFVKNLPFGVSKGGLEMFFQRFGTVVQLFLVPNRFAIVTMLSKDMADSIVEKSNTGKLLLQGHALKVTAQKAKKV